MSFKKLVDATMKHGNVALTETAGGETRYPVKEGDAFFFSRNTLIGFYSGGKEGEAHAPADD